MEMIPKIIHYCWFGGADIPDSFLGYINEWKELHPTWKVIRWDESNFELNTDYLTTAKETGNWSNISNYVRLKVLYDFGGVYLDTDFKVIKPLDDLLVFECFVGFEDGTSSTANFSVNSAIIGSVPNHHFIYNCLKDYTLLFDGREPANLSAPVLLTDVLKNKYGLTKYGEQLIDGVKIFEKEVFYPLPFDKAYNQNYLENYITPQTIAVHVWGRSWYSKYDLLERIDSQTRFIDEHLKYIKELEERINSKQGVETEENRSYFLISSEIEKIHKITDSIALSSKNQEYYLNTLNKRFDNMENNYKNSSEKQESTMIYNFLLERLNQLEVKISELRVDQKVHEKNTIIEQGQRDKAIREIEEDVNELTCKQADLLQLSSNMKQQFNEVVQELYQAVTNSQEEFKKEVLSNISSSVYKFISTAKIDKIEQLPIVENLSNTSDGLQASNNNGLKSTENNSSDDLAELIALRLQNELLLKEQQELRVIIQNYESDDKSKQEDFSRLNFKLNSLTTYIDNFGHVRNEYEQRIKLLEDLIQKMRLKNRAKRLVGIYKENN